MKLSNRDKWEQVMRAVPTLSTDALTVRPWPDDVIDAVGHDPRSHYVERFWLGILGPSTTWLLRRVAAGLEASPAGFDLSLTETARSLGLGGEGGTTAVLLDPRFCRPFERGPPPLECVA